MKRAVPQGTWLAFLALAVQVLLPFLVAYEIALVSAPAHAESKTVICSASSATTAAASHRIDHATHHGLSGNCPLCVTLAASQAFTAPPPVVLPLPATEAAIERYPTPPVLAFANAAAFYNPRAPPSLV